jgi:hypothetical protein
MIAERLRNTHTLIDEIDNSPVALDVNTKDEREMTTKSIIRHDERNAEKLFNLAAMLCILCLGNCWRAKNLVITRRGWWTT